MTAQIELATGRDKRVLPIRQSGWLPYFAYHKHPQHFIFQLAELSRRFSQNSGHLRISTQLPSSPTLSKMSAGQGLVGLIGPRGHAGRDGDQGPRGNDGERGQRGEPGELLPHSQSAYTHISQGGAVTSETAVRKVIRENAVNGDPEETVEHPETAANGDPEASVVKPRNPCTWM